MENRVIVGSVSPTAPVLILVHDDVDPPVQPIFGAPMARTTSLKCSGVNFALSREEADSNVVFPAVWRMRSILPIAARAGHWWSLIGMRCRSRQSPCGFRCGDERLGGDRLAGRMVGIEYDVVKKHSLISLQGKGVVAA
jgi:hypothetical protein